ncbi:MAG TPA: STAS domain-containing protein [Bryocella sp.]|nr:STAS domain-containing protein [Bryocella sp.]
MLRISVVQDRGSACFLLEGRLDGPWVDELRGVWQQAVGSADRSQLVVDLRGVTAMDTRGQRLLKELLQHGATLRCSDVMNQYLVEQMGVSGRPPETCRPCRRFTTQSDVSATAAETELVS